MAFSFKSLFTRDEAPSSRPAGAGGRLNLNPGVPAAPPSAPDPGGENPNRQAMQPESPFATPFSGSPIVPVPVARVSPFEVVGGPAVGPSPVAVAGSSGAGAPVYAAVSPPSPYAAAPVAPMFSAEAVAAPPESPFGAGFSAQGVGGWGNGPQAAEGTSPFAVVSPPAPDPRVQDLESRGFRPLSSLPGGTVPAPTQFAGGFGAGNAPAAAAHSGFASPFSAQGPPASPALPTYLIPTSPFEAVPATPVPSAPVPAGPLMQAPSAPFPAGPGDAGAATERAVSGDGKFELSVREVLLDVAQERLGFDPSRVPGDVMVRFPFSLITPQLSAGRVVVRLSDVVDGCAEKYRPAFAKSDLGSNVTLPIESIFHQLPMGRVGEVSAGWGTFAPAAEPTRAPETPASFASALAPVAVPRPEAAGHFREAVEPTVPPPSPAGFGGGVSFGSGLPAFETPFSSPAAEDAAPPLPVSPFAVASSPFGLPPTPAAAPEAPVERKASPWDAPPFFPAATTTPAVAPAAAPSAFAGLQPLGGMQAAAPPAPAASPFLSEVGSEAEATVGSTGAQPVSAWSMPEPPASGAFSLFGAPAFEDDAVEAFESLGRAADAVAAPSVPPAEETFEPVAGFQAARFSEDKDQRSLRALFMSDEHFDAGAVVRHCRALPGVDACVLLSRNGEIRCGAGGEDFAAKASAMLGAVISLAEGLGLSDAETFSMRTDKGMVSFFRADPVYLGVHHSNRGFAPGVQEKLALASAELARMSGI